MANAATPYFALARVVQNIEDENAKNINFLIHRYINIGILIHTKRKIHSNLIFLLLFIAVLQVESSYCIPNGKASKPLVRYAKICRIIA